MSTGNPLLLLSRPGAKVRKTYLSGNIDPLTTACPPNSKTSRDREN